MSDLMKEFCEEVNAYIQQVGKEIKWEEAHPLLDVAASHGETFTWRQTRDQLKEAGIDIEDPCYRYARGYNGKRPVYFIKTKEGKFFIAEGYFFGNHSSFTILFPSNDYSMRKVAARICPTSQLTRWNFKYDLSLKED